MKVACLSRCVPRSIPYQPVSLFFCSLILICLKGWKLLFDLEWPILKCLHSGKECQVAYAKTYLNMQYNRKFRCAYEILLLMCQWWNIEHPGLFLMKIHPVERKLYQIINWGGGTTALVYYESVSQSVSCPVYPAFDVGDRPHWT